MNLDRVTFKCEYCGKTYRSDAGYEKHKLICDLINLDREETFSIHRLSKIVIELVKSNNKLEREVSILKKQSQVKKQRIIILDILNNAPLPETKYEIFLDSICLTREDLEIIFSNNYIAGFSLILHSLIKKNNYLSIFKSFEQKDNTIYIFKEQWEILTVEDFDKLFSLISKKILVEFHIWQDENSDILYTEKFSSQYIANVKKIVGKDSLEKQRGMVHRNLYKFLQQNIQHIVEYEFT